MMFYGLTCLFKPATKKAWILLAYGVFVLASSWIFFQFGNELLTLAFNTASFLGIAFLFRGRLGARLIFSFLLYMLTVVADAIAFVGLSYIYYRQYGTTMPPEFVITVVRTVANIAFLPLLLLSTIIFRRIFARKVRHSLFKVPAVYTGSVLLLLLGIAVINLFLILAEIPYVQTSLVRLLASQFIVLIIIFFVIWLYNTLLGHLEANEKSRQRDLMLERWEGQYKAVTSTQKVIRDLKHNLRYHFITLLKYAQSGDVQKIETHIEAELGAFDHIIHTGNLSIDAVINYYKQRIDEVLGIKLNTNIWVPPDMAIDASFIVLALGNALENAMEACEHVAPAERYMRLEANTVEDKLLVIVENPYTVAPIVGADDNLVTTKTDKKNHGLGLASIQERLSEEVGYIDVEYADGVFRFKLLLRNILA